MSRGSASSILLGFIFLLMMGSAVRAQSTLMNVPSTDVVAPRDLYLEMDFITNYAWKRDEGSFQNYIPRAVVGVGKKVEAGINLSYTHVPGGGQPMELQPNVKWQFYSNEETGMAAAVGCIGYVPITHRAGTHSIVQCYSVVSKQVKGSYGPRFTGGAYTVLNANSEDGTRNGAIAAYEQPLSKSATFIIDWFSGDNRFGFVSPGISFIMPRNSSLTAGYAIANRGAGKNALFAYYGMTF